MNTHPSPFRTAALTSITLVAFAANSLLTRMALGDGSIDAASFMTVRIGSGAAMLWLILSWKNTAKTKNLVTKSEVISTQKSTPWTAAFMLFLYAVTFSFSYLQLAAGTGALILFGTVQVTMI
ncbi:MAG: EamA family transporter, partial [Cyanobacteria bacterium J06659_2]